MKKRILSRMGCALLAAVLICLACPMTAWAEETEDTVKIIPYQTTSRYDMGLDP